MTSSSEQSWTVRDLRRRWKPTKEKLGGQPFHEPILIRMHRAFSWLQRVEELDDSAVFDTGLIFQWIALNRGRPEWPFWQGLQSSLPLHPSSTAQ